MGCTSSVHPSPSHKACRRSACSTSSEPSPVNFIENWRVLHKLGEGAYAHVFAVKHRSSSRCAALKVIKSAPKNRNIFEEAMIWEEVGRQDHIVNLIEHFVIDGTHVILMEKCDYSLRELLRDMPIASEDAMARMFPQMISAIAHLESLRIVHRDVKLDNFLCAGSDQTLKLCDFGLASKVPKSCKLFGTFGTPYYMSPEMICDGPHNLKTDVWSLGVTCYLMFYGEHPYTTSSPSAQSVMQAIAIGFPEPRFQGRDNVSHMAKEALGLLLHRPVSTRIYASQALLLPFFSGAVDRFSAKPSTLSSESLSELKSQSTCDMGDMSYILCESTSEDSSSSPRFGLMSL